MARNDDIMPNAACNIDWIGSHYEQWRSIKLQSLSLEFCQSPTWATSIGKLFYQGLLSFWRAHDGEPHPIAAQLVEDHAGFARAQIEEAGGQVLGIQESGAGIRRETGFEDERRVLRPLHHAMAARTLDGADAVLDNQCE